GWFPLPLYCGGLRRRDDRHRFPGRHIPRPELAETRVVEEALRAGEQGHLPAARRWKPLERAKWLALLNCIREVAPFEAAQVIRAAPWTMFFEQFARVVEGAFVYGL